MKNKMPYELRTKLVALRFRGKKGECLHPDEIKFFSEMLNKYPEEYGEVEKEIQEMAMKYMNPFYKGEEEEEE